MTTHDAEFEQSSNTLEAIRELREEMRLEMNDLAESVAQAPTVRRPTSAWAWIMPTVLVVGGVAAGIVATVGYYEGNPQAPPVSDTSLLTQAELNSALAPQTKRLEYLTSTVNKLSESKAAQDTAPQQQSLKQLQTTVATLLQTVQEQSQQFKRDIEQTRTDLTTEVAKLSEELRKPTTVGRASLPDETQAALEPTPDATASVQTESPGEPRPLPDEPAPEQPIVRGKLLLHNNGTEDVELLINNVRITVRAGGVTNVPVSVGVVKTQFASSPDNAAFWDQWDFSSSEPRLSIDVHFGTGFVELRPHS